MSFFSSGAVWCIIAFLLLGAEMMTGTLYLLCCTAGCFAAALLWLFDFSLSAQIFAAAAVTALCACTVFCLRRRLRRSCHEDLNDLDAGQRVLVESVAADGSALVSYRGAKWPAVALDQALTPGTWEILRADGPRLILKKKLFD